MIPADIIARAQYLVAGALHPIGLAIATVAVNALAAAGYRILGPDELDGHTLEKAASVADERAERCRDHASLAGNDVLRQREIAASAECRMLAARIRTLQENPDVR